MTESQVHASCVAIAGQGVLIRGPSGAGKSDLALRLIDEGGFLVADDRVDLAAADGVLTARPPEALAGLIEVRGVGIVKAARIVAKTKIALVVDLVEIGAVERLPEPDGENILGVDVPKLALFAFAASTPAKIRLALDQRPGDML
ncbi:MAG: aldolase [Proteobacteria bacterium]|nr:aldolase [Pseudomonadota bacterium]